MFKNVEELKQWLIDNDYEGTAFFDPDFSEAVVGIDIEGRLVYDFDLMVESIMEDGINEEDAIEWINFNTVRTLPYMGEKAPIIIRRISYE